jgi:hypothetical protein
MSEDLSFQSALEYFKSKGGKEADMMTRQPLQFLKSNESHKLRILPGIPKPFAWFATCSRHYMGNAPLQVIRRQGARKSAICPCSISNEPCFLDHARSYLEAIQAQNLANELISREAAIVNAYRANEADPVALPFLMTKTTIGQLMDQWKEGYNFFDPEKGFPVKLSPLEGTNMFSVTMDTVKVGSVPQHILDQAKPLSEIIQSLLIPYESMQSWFVQPFVENVLHFLKTNEARSMDWSSIAIQSAASTQTPNTQVAAAQTTEIPFTPPQEGLAQPGFLSQLQNQMEKLNAGK